MLRGNSGCGILFLEAIDDPSAPIGFIVFSAASIQGEDLVDVDEEKWIILTDESVHCPAWKKESKLARGLLLLNLRQAPS